jgi:glycosyltransferase involved in cell wall biosynthesis
MNGKRLSQNIMKPRVAVVRGKFLNKYEMQFFEPLAKDFSLTAFGSLTSYHDIFVFPTIKLVSPMDLPEFPYKMPLLNRLFVDAHYLVGLESRLAGFDLVHTAETYFHYTQQCLNAKKKGIVRKVIATVLENIPHNNESIWGRKAYKKRSRDELDHMIALTQKTKEALVREGADERKITIIHHYVDTKLFKPRASLDSSRSRKRDMTILYTGRLEEYKGVFDILAAAKRLSMDSDMGMYSLRFLFVGDGSALGKMKDVVNGHGLASHVSFKHVPYEEMPLVYSSSDIFIAPSKPTKTYEEQYCTALLEAQACGLPIVTTVTGGIPENVGNAAILVKPGDVDGITEALKEYILRPQLRIRFGQKARIRAQAVHDIQVGAHALKELYQKVLFSV